MRNFLTMVLGMVLGAWLLFVVIPIGLWHSAPIPFRIWNFITNTIDDDERTADAVSPDELLAELEAAGEVLAEVLEDDIEGTTDELRAEFKDELAELENEIALAEAVRSRLNALIPRLEATPGMPLGVPRWRAMLAEIDVITQESRMAIPIFRTTLEQGDRVALWLELSEPSDMRILISTLRNTRMESEETYRLIEPLLEGVNTRSLTVPDIVRPSDFSGRGVERGPEGTTDRSDFAIAPSFTPREVEPELRNRDEISRALQQAYPSLLRDAGIGGTAILWFLISEEGSVITTQLFESSGFGALDEAAIQVASLMQFSPALDRDQAVEAWVQLPITFEVR